MKNKGFTLVELLAVIVILAIILAIAVPRITSLIENSKKNSFESNTKMLLKAVQIKLLENSSFDITTINKDNLETLLNIEGDNYSKVSIKYGSNNKPYISIEGKDQWSGYSAYGNFNNLRVESTIVTDGLVLYLDAANAFSYPGSGTTWYDLSGNGNNVSLINSPTWNSIGFFENNATSYFSGPGSASVPTGNSAYSIGVWARQNTSWGSANGLISIGSFNVANAANALRTHNNVVGNFSHYWWANDLVLLNNNSNLSLSKWFYIVAQFNGTTRTIWINGIQYLADNPTAHNVTSTVIQISKTFSNEYQQGDMAVAFIYNRALTQSEIQQNYNAQKDRYGL